MNQEEISNHISESENTSDSSETNENSAAGETQISAPAQIVEDISADPAKVIESAFSEEKKPENSETPQTNETPDNSTIAPVTTGNHQLINAMVGKHYQDSIDLKELKIENAKLVSNFAEQLEKLGFSVKREGAIIKIEGSPLAETQGEHDFYVDYVDNDEEKIQRKEFSLLINPNPKSLWKNIEPDDDLPYRKDHEALKTVMSENFKIVAASRRGRSHAHEGKFREDDFAVRSGQNGWHILIVADGAGSAKLSRQGSYLACQTAVEYVENSIVTLLEPKFDALINEFAGENSETSEKEIKNLLYQVLCGAAFKAYKRLEQESTETENSLKDYSTTFLLSIVKKCANGFFIAAFGIGDGAIGVYSESPDVLELMNIPDGGEFSGQTRFLTMREVIGDGAEMLKRIKFKLFDEFSMLALMSDGISDPKFGTDNNLASFEKWKEFVHELGAEINFSRDYGKTASQLLDYMDFWSPGEHDDRTLAILY